MAEEKDKYLPADPKDKEALRTQALHDFQNAEEAESENRQTALEDIRFARLSEQWNEADRLAREQQGRPCLTINKLLPIIRQVVNDARQNKPTIKVLASDSAADPATAQVIGGLIRNIEYQSNADTAYDTATECAVSGGFGYIRVGIDYAYDDSFDMDINIQRVSNPFAVYGDPASTSADGSDWNVAFVTNRMRKEEYLREYPNAEIRDFDDAAWKDAGTSWFEDDMVTVAEYWRREPYEKTIYPMSDGSAYDEETFQSEDVQFAIQVGQIAQAGKPRKVKSHRVYQHILSGAEVLKSTLWPGCYIPIVPVYGDEIDIEGKRYFRSLIHNSIDAQKMFNFQRSASAELISLTPKVPFIGRKGAFDSDIDRWNTANTAAHPFLEYDGPEPPQRQPLDTGPAAGALQEAMNASDDVKATSGIYDASLGARSNETSGKAIMARQREGDVSTFHFIDNMARAIRQLGRIIIDLLPKVYTTDRMIRILGEDGEPGEVKIGAEALYKQVPVMDPNTGQPAIDPMTGQPQMQQQLDEQGKAILDVHALGVGKYDIVVKTGPSFTSRREEAVQTMTEAMRAYPPSAPIVLPEIWKNMDFPGADKVAKKFAEQEAGTIPPQAQEQMEQMGKQLEQVAGELEQTKQENESLKLDQQAEMAKIQAQAELQQQKLQADIELQRMKFMAEMQLEREKFRAEMELEREKAAVQQQQKYAEMDANNQFEQHRISLDSQRMDGEKADRDLKQAEKAGTDELKGMIAELKKVLLAPVVIDRDPKTGKSSGARRVLN